MSKVANVETVVPNKKKPFNVTRLAEYLSQADPGGGTLGAGTGRFPCGHATSIGPGDYNTMCGIDADDPGIGHTGTVKPRPGQKINCRACKTMWIGMRSLRLRAADFEDA